MPNWQPLTTAPKDGAEILIRYPLQGNVKELVNWNRFRGYWQSKGEPVLGIWAQEVEWHPLPEDASVPASNHLTQEAPVGWRLVPVEATQEMLDAADAIVDSDPRFVAVAYRAMLAAAPALPITPAAEQKDDTPGVRVLDEAQPVAWMTEAACSSPVVTDDFLKQYPQWRSTYTIPLYRSAPGVKVDAPPADQLREMWQAAMARAYSEDEGEAYEFFACALLAAAGVPGMGTTLEVVSTVERIYRALNQPGLSESKLATTIPMRELVAFVEALPPTSGVLGPVHQTKADHTPSDGQESGGGKAMTDAEIYCAWDGAGSPCTLAVFTLIVRATEAHHKIAAAASVGQAAPDGEGGKDHG